MSSRTESLWRVTHPLSHPASAHGFPALAGNIEADVAIVGGGISGLTAAVILARAGQRVVLVEREGIGSGETGNTTSHLTEAIDARYSALIRNFGEEGARLAARSSREVQTAMMTVWIALRLKRSD